MTVLQSLKAVFLFLFFLTSQIFYVLIIFTVHNKINLWIFKRIIKFSKFILSVSAAKTKRTILNYIIKMNDLFCSGSTTFFLNILKIMSNIIHF